MINVPLDAKPRGAIVSILLLLAGWALAGPGRLATAAILEREHSVELSVAEGRVDLRLGHRSSTPGDHRHANPTSADHVLHLWASADLLAPRAPGVDAPVPALVGPTRWATRFAFHVSPSVAVPRRPPARFAPARSVPLLL